MKLREVIDYLELNPVFLANEEAGELDVESAYCGDLLSDVLANAPPNSLWFTIQAHVNIVAVAQLRDLAAVVLVNGATPDPQTIAKAKAQDVNLCCSSATSAELCMRLAGKFQF